MTQPRPPIHSQACLILILGMLCAFPPLATDMYLPALPQMARDFGVGGGRIEATLSAFFIGLAVGQAFYGPLIDRYGRRVPLLLGIGLYILTSGLCLATGDIQILIGLRFLQAVGGCAGMIIGRAIVSDLFEERESARVLSLMMMVMTLAPIIAPSLGGLILAVTDWRAIFKVMAGFGVLSGLLVWFGLPESLPRAKRRRDGLGPTLQAYGGLLTRRGFIVPALVGGLAQASMFAFITGSPFVFITLHGVSEQTYGLLFGAIAAGLIAAAELNRRLLLHHSPGALLTGALLFNIVAGLTLVTLAGQPLLLLTVIPLALTIASLGFIGADATAIVMASSQTHTGGVSALIGVLQFGCAFVASSLVAAAQNGTAYPMALTVAGSGILAGAVWFAFQPRPTAAIPVQSQRGARRRRGRKRGGRRHGSR